MRVNSNGDVGQASPIWKYNSVGMKKDNDERVPSSNSAGIEDIVIGGGIVDQYGELIANPSASVKINKLDIEDSYKDIDSVFGALAYDLTNQGSYVGVSKNDSDIYNEVRQASQKSKILSYAFVQDLFPTIVNSWGSGNSLVDTLFGNKKDDGLLSILNSISELNRNLVDFQNSMDHGRLNAFDHSEYLSRNSGKLESVADYITDEYKVKIGKSNLSDDDRAYAIMEWVQENLKYVSDMDHHGKSEKWSTAVETLRDLKGDCEDGAFLEMGLALASGIDRSRVRFYGGLVQAGTNAETGGHGWWSYKRERDDEWVVLDWCYLPNQKTIDKRKPMRDDVKYLTDWFVVMGNGLTIDTGAINTVRNPDALDRWDNYSTDKSGNSLALGDFKTTGQELLTAHKYIANRYLEQGLEISGLMKNNGNAVFFLSELNKRIREENILDLQKKVSEGFSKFMTTDDYLKARAS